MDTEKPQIIVTHDDRSMRDTLAVMGRDIARTAGVEIVAYAPEEAQRIIQEQIDGQRSNVIGLITGVTSASKTHKNRIVSRMGSSVGVSVLELTGEKIVDQAVRLKIPVAVAEMRLDELPPRIGQKASLFDISAASDILITKCRDFIGAVARKVNPDSPAA